MMRALRDSLLLQVGAVALNGGDALERAGKHFVISRLGPFPRATRHSDWSLPEGCKSAKACTRFYVGGRVMAIVASVVYIKSER